MSLPSLPSLPLLLLVLFPAVPTTHAWSSAFAPFVGNNDFCDCGFGRGCGYICAGGGSSGGGGGCPKDACSSGQYSFDAATGWRIEVPKALGGGKVPYRAFAYLSFCDGKQMSQCWSKAATSPMVFSFSFMTTDLAKWGAYSKLLFWTDSGNIMGLLPPGTAAAKQKGLTAAALVAFPTTDFPNGWADKLDVVDGTWYDVRVEFSPSGGTTAIKLEIDGKLFSSGSIPVGIAGDTNGPQLGVYSFDFGGTRTTEQFDLYLKNVALVDGTLSAVPYVPPVIPPTTGGGASTSVIWTKGFSGRAEDQTMDVKSGEVLEFEWKGTHNVYRMQDKAAFDACDFSTATKLGAASPLLHTMGTATTYFACNVGAHCNSGQKLSAVVVGGGGGDSGKAAADKAAADKAAADKAVADKAVADKAAADKAAADKAKATADATAAAEAKSKADAAAKAAADAKAIADANPSNKAAADAAAAAKATSDAAKATSDSANKAVADGSGGGSGGRTVAEGGLGGGAFAVGCIVAGFLLGILVAALGVWCSGRVGKADAGAGGGTPASTTRTKACAAANTQRGGAGAGEWVAVTNQYTGVVSYVNSVTGETANATW